MRGGLKGRRLAGNSIVPHSSRRGRAGQKIAESARAESDPKRPTEHVALQVVERTEGKKYLTFATFITEKCFLEQFHFLFVVTIYAIEQCIDFAADFFEIFVLVFAESLDFRQ